MTKREFFNLISALHTDRADIVDFCAHEIELLDRKAGYKSNKPTAKQVENEGIKAKIVEYLGTVERATVTDIVGALGGGYANQKVSALVTQLEKGGVVAKSKDKRVTYISLA